MSVVLLVLLPALGACQDSGIPARFTRAEDAARSVDARPAPASTTTTIPATTTPGSGISLAYPTTTTSTTTSVVATTTPLLAPLVPDGPDAWQNEMLATINRLRSENGAGPLVLCPLLSAAAQTHAAGLAATGRIDETPSDPDLLAALVEASGYGPASVLSEGLTAGQRSGQAALNAWWAVPARKAHLLDRTYTHLGLGRADLELGAWEVPYWVQLLAAGGTC